MTETENIVPVVSIAAIAASVAEADVSEEDLRRAGEVLVSAFADTGFCYVTDHGIDQSLLDKSLDVIKDFFHLPIETKKRRLRGEFKEDFYGWLPIPNTEGIDRKPETFDHNKPPDYKESYNLSDNLDETRFPSDDEVPGFRATSLQLIDQLRLVTERMLHALGYALNLEDPLALCKISSKLGTKENKTTLRYAFYPRVPPEKMESGMLRCGEHTDFGYVTLLLNNGVSGLQIQTRSGEYVMVPPHESALAANIADSLERVTGGILRSTPHRVIINEENSAKDRYSIVYFRGPDDNAYLDPVCGEKEKYEKGIMALDFYNKRFEDIFIHGTGVMQNATSK